VIATLAAPTAAHLTHVQVGDGPDVVLIHGALTCLDDMAIALFDALEPQFRVTAFDRPGHGRNRAPGGGTACRQAGELREAAAALGIEMPVLVGHSFGGAVAMAWALRFPAEVSGVAALSPIAFPEPRLEHLLFAPRAMPGPVGFWNHTLGRLADPVLLPILWRAMFLPQTMPVRFAGMFPFDLAGRAEQLLSEGQDSALMGAGVGWNALNYARCRAPVHVLSGDRDLVVNPGLHAAGLARQLPHSRHTKLRGLGHMVHHFAQPAVVDAVRDLHAGRLSEHG
jgi:pimeloyl-ACP methyl ester carboxylesterase